MKTDKKENKKKKAERPQTIRELLDTYVPELPGRFAGNLTRTIMRLLIIKRPAVFHYGFDKKAMKGRPVLILAQHVSRDDPYYVASGYHFVLPNSIMSLHNALIPGMLRLLLADGVILKSLYEPDIRAMRHLVRLHKKGASFMLFPEGIQSADGTTQPVHPATARLIKKMAMDTVLCTAHGAYLCNPRFDTNKRRGRIEYSFDILFTKEEIKEMTEDEIYSRLIEKFRYNDFAWNSEKGYRYKGKVPCAHGLDNILFACPQCGRQFGMHVDGDRLICGCGHAVTVDDSYDLAPDDSSFPFRRIDEWYRWQQDVIDEEVSREDFGMEEEVTYKMLNLDERNLRKGRLVTVGEGRLTLDHDRLRYVGTRNGEDVDLGFDISRLPSVVLTTKMAGEFYYDGEFHQFAIKGDRRHAAKLMLAVEALHEKGDELRRKAREDVRNQAGFGYTR